VKTQFAFDLESEEETPEESWKRLFSEANIKQVFHEKIAPKGGRGVDRISVARFEKELNEQAVIICRKCRIGTYKFSPYLEQLISKGKDKKPRVISIPTIRDKIVLKVLTEFIHQHFSDYIAKDLPNTVIKKIKKELEQKDNLKSYIRLDIARFYDSIGHTHILEKIKKEIDYLPFIKLLRKAITNPTLASGYSAEKRKITKNEKGVPQGLSISNILAEIYASTYDSKIKPLSIANFRFVDDIFILCEMNKVLPLWGVINNATKKLGLELNHEKGTPEYESWDVEKGLEFLGYRFEKDKISVKDASYNRFVHSIVGKITKFKYRKIAEDKLSQDVSKKVFIDDLNERITGAIDENKRYGWAFFFSEINDVDLLHRIDMVVRKNLDRLPNFSKEDKKAIKSVVRAHYEAKHSPKRGYIHNYNSYKTISQKIYYLKNRGLLKEDAQYTDKQIERLFIQVKAKNLLKLERDVSNIS